MKSFLLLAVFVSSHLAMSGCSKNGDVASDPGGTNSVVSTNAKPTSPNDKNDATTEPRLLAGEKGSSSRWGSGWLDLATAMDFAAGDVLRLRVGGTAGKVLVRLLPDGEFPDSSDGIVGGVVTVPENRIVEVTLNEDRKGIIQISVHGGPSPWDKYPLGSGNGSAMLEEAILVR